MTQVSNFIIPAVIFLVVGFGVLGHVKIYESFLKGASDGLKIVVEIVPTLIGLMMGVGILRASGFFTLLERALAPVAALFGFPAQILSLLTVKLFSSSAATGLVLDVFATYGPDSYPGLITSIVMSCTETVFYTMSVYFLAAKVTKTRYTLTGALLSTAAGTIAGIILAAAIA
ncbi:MAG: spore maturation protein [Lachnospiraceae bacterium]|nr:spore maturation protein [Lachnospiraceae bacterium]MBR3507373.1 spore maturation protein [Lachnospiraceae bacterium]MBR4607979.1 spore maturation protein [Lachnospiraceae bacterium]